MWQYEAFGTEASVTEYECSEVLWYVGFSSSSKGAPKEK